jgi:hypothetical protein
MSNHNHDHIDPAHIKPPPRMPVEAWDKYEIDKENAPTQKPK